MGIVGKKTMDIKAKAEWTHDALVKKAERWLFNIGCSVILSERHTSNREIPDAIGWRSGHFSTVIECKVSRSDFLADQGKPFRGSENGMGHERFYLAPKGLIKPEELPEGWGLLEIGEKNITEEVHALRRFVYDFQAEITMLVSSLRRVQLSGMVFIEREPFGGESA
jgi:hypothetical protein